uniref:Peptidase aspartic putative domain-containing protein n=1 Tax=Panagrolaimus sp. PS1159 TaxID=55785 RepID=A0AC35GDM5_9BILA
MANRIFNQLDALINAIKQRQNDYEQRLQQTQPPWTEIQKVTFKARLKRLHGDLEMWKDYIETLETKANHMLNNDAEKPRLFNCIDEWKIANQPLFDDITLLILEGEGYLELHLELDADNRSDITQDSETSQILQIPTKILQIPSLNIQKFNGDYLKWKPFWQRFEINVHNRPFSNVDKLDALMGLLEGRALEEVEGFQISEENYDTVVNTLQTRFGNQALILNKLQGDLRSLPCANSNSNSLRTTVNTISNMCRQLQNYGVNIDNTSLKLDIIDKMPPKERNELKYFSVTHPEATTEELLQKMKDFALKAEIYSETRTMGSGFQKSQSSSQSPKFQPSSNIKPINSNKNFTCSFCDGDHFSSRCPKFDTVDAKFNQLKFKNCCTKCAGHNHHAKSCNASVKCKICNGRHLTFLCKSKDSQKFEKPNNTKSFVSVGGKHGFLLTKKVMVMNPETNQDYEAVVFFDSGSHRSLISNKIVSQLKLRKHNEEYLNIQGIGAKATIYKSILTQLRIKTNEGFRDIFANSIPQIATTIPLIETDILEEFKLSDLKITNKTTPKDEYFVVDSVVGKMLSGSIPQSAKNIFSALAIDTKQLYNYDDELQNLWKFEAMGIKDEHHEKSEMEILEKFKESITFNDNRFYVSWPTKTEHKPLPTNAGLSIGRLNSTLKKLSQTPHLLQEYQNIIDKQHRQGIIEIAPEQPQGKLIHYLPHHAVITPQKTTTKVRMVFDGSAKNSKDAASLNDCFIRGPLKIPDICGILLRIRTCLYLLMGDIEKAFHQVYLNEKDRDAVRFFWVKDPAKPASGDNLIVYRFVAVPFGIISSPFILWIIILILIQKFDDQKLRQMIADNTYVDNIFLMTDYESEGVQYYEKTRKHFGAASMNVREWLSNSKFIYESFPEEIKQQDRIAKILGIQWNSENDTLMLKINNEKSTKDWTKRNVLKFIASNFDPLGLLSPFTMKGKIFIQKLFVLIPIK